MREKVLDRETLEPKDNTAENIHPNPRNSPNSISPPSQVICWIFQSVKLRKSSIKYFFSLLIWFIYFLSINYEFSSFSLIQFEGHTYDIAKSWHLYFFAPNPIKIPAKKTEFVYKTSQANFNWVKGFVYPPLKSDPAGCARVSRLVALMVSESYLWWFV